MPFIEDTQCGRVTDTESAVVAVIHGEREEWTSLARRKEFWGLIV